MTVPTGAGGTGLRIVAFGTYQADSHPRVQVLIEGLRAAGHEVIEINEPLGLSTADRVSMLQKPWTAPVLPARLVVRWARLWRRGRALRRQQRPDAVLVGYLGHFDVHLARRVFRGSTIVLDHLVFAAGTALDRGAAKGVLTGALEVVDRRALSAADVIVLDTAEHRDAVPAHLRGRAVVAPVGADAAWFSAAAGAVDGPSGSEPLKVVFYGLYTPLQGTVVIGRALRRLAEMGVDASQVSVTMIGTGQDLQATREAAGPDAPVQWIEWVPAADLPAVVAAHHVALGIFGTTVKAGNVVPNKVYQAAAAGCAVVTSDTPPQRRLLGEAADFVPAGDPEALAMALVRLVGDRDRLAERRRRMRELATRSFTASAIVGDLMDRLPPV